MIGEDIHTMPISVNMSRMPNLTYLEEDELIIYAADQMIEKEIDSIPIVKNKGNNKYQVTGRISKQQLQNYLYHYLKNRW